MRYIFDAKDRAITFSKRKNGLLKKAAELSILCGLKVSLLFSDIKTNLFHVFSNDSEYRICYEQFLKDNRIKEDCTFLEYSIFDYPFEATLEDDHENKVIVEQAKQIQASLAELKSAVQDKEPGVDLLKKRDSKGEQASAGDLDSRSQKRLVLAEEEERKARQVVNKFVGMEGITSETAAAVEGFIADLDSLLKAALDGSDKKRRTDEEMIVLLTTRQLVSKYFCFTDKMFFLDEHFSLVIRDKISLSNMTAALLSFRNRGVASSNDLSQLDTAIPKLRLFSDSLVELIVNPSNFDINSFSSRKGGKSIITVFIFMLKNFLQQSRVLEALYSENSGQNNIKGLIQEENVRYVADSINCALNFMAYEHFRTDGSLSSSKFHRLSIPKPQVITVSGELFGLQGLVQLEKTAELFHHNSLLVDNDNPNFEARRALQFDFSEGNNQRRSMLLNSEEGNNSIGADNLNLFVSNLLMGKK